jgi:hypothetical protein
MRLIGMIEVLDTDTIDQLHRPLSAGWINVCVLCLRIQRAGQWTEERGSGTAGHSTGFCDECARAQRLELNLPERTDA